MVKMLVIGENGQLGRALRRLPEFAQAQFLGRETADLSEPESLPAALEALTFDVLVNAAAYTAVDKAEDEEERAMRINGVSPGVLAEICEKRGAAMIHVSTDYVFGHTGASPLKTDHPTAPINAYGRTKLAGEIAVRQGCKHHLILRTAWLYGVDGQNFVKTMLRLGREKSYLSVVYDQVGAPTFVKDLAEAIAAIARTAFDEKANVDWGTYHFSNRGVCSWYDVAHAIFRLRGMEVDLRPVRSDAFPTRAQRPAYGVLDTEKITRNFGLKIRHWRDALEECLDEMENRGES